MTARATLKKISFALFSYSIEYRLQRMKKNEGSYSIKYIFNLMETEFLEDEIVLAALEPQSNMNLCLATIGKRIPLTLTFTCPPKAQKANVVSLHLISHYKLTVLLLLPSIVIVR